MAHRVNGLHGHGTGAPTSGPVGMAVTISGTNFGASQGSGTVTFGGVIAGAVPYWSATSITVTVPSGAITGNVVVTVNGLTSSTPFAVTAPPVISGLSAPNGAPDASITISGTGFGPLRGSGAVWLGSTYGTPVSAAEPFRFAVESCPQSSECAPSSGCS